MKRIITVFFAWLMCRPGPDYPRPKWRSNGSQLASPEGIREYAKYADDLGKWTIEWYNCKNRRKKFWSFLWRTATIVSSTVGVLIPVITARPEYYKFGYFFALVAVFFLAIDRNFGFTSSWVRTVKASRAVETALTEFHTNTMKLAASNPTSLTRDWAQCVQDFLLKVRSLVDQEAETWSTETLANFSQLDRMVATGADEARKRYEQALDSLRAGGIELTIENPPPPPRTCSISVRGEIRKRNWSTPVCGLTEILPGPAEVRVDAVEADGTTWEASRAVMIPSGAILSAVSFKLFKLSQKRQRGEAAGDAPKSPDIRTLDDKSQEMHKKDAAAGEKKEGTAEKEKPSQEAQKPSDTGASGAAPSSELPQGRTTYFGGPGEQSTGAKESGAAGRPGTKKVNEGAVRTDR